MADIKSMTGSASVPVTGSFADFTIDITTVNSRFLEVYLKMPDTLRHLDAKLRALVAEKLTRGKVDCVLSLKINSGSALNINQDFLLSLKNALAVIKGALPDSSVNALEVLNYPGVLGQDPNLQEKIDEAVLKGFEKALDEVVANRVREGAKLTKALNDRLDLIEKELDAVAPQLADLTNLERARISEKIKKMQLDVDPARFEQEVAMAAQKSDIEEEYDRLRSHISEARQVLGKGGICGKRLDFLTQEFNREANTMASKASNLSITKTAVELKVLIEQLREQCQNIE